MLLCYFGHTTSYTMKFIFRQFNMTQCNEPCTHTVIYTPLQGAFNATPVVMTEFVHGVPC